MNNSISRSSFYLAVAACLLIAMIALRNRGSISSEPSGNLVDNLVSSVAVNVGQSTVDSDVKSDFVSDSVVMLEAEPMPEFQTTLLPPIETMEAMEAETADAKQASVEPFSKPLPQLDSVDFEPVGTADPAASLTRSPEPSFSTPIASSIVDVESDIDTAWQNPDQNSAQATWTEPLFRGLGSDEATAIEDSVSVFESENTERFAALPQQESKPKFRKFGAAKVKSGSQDSDRNDDEDDDDDDDVPPPKQPVVLSASNRWKLAEGPKKGYRYKDDTPLTDGCSTVIHGVEGNFSPTPTMQGMPYDPYGNMEVYQGKTLNATQRPLIELGRPWYQLGPISEGSSILGFHNHVNPQYIVFGDFRTGVASNRSAGDTTSQIASQLNLFHHFKFTSTERFVAGHTPLTSGGRNARYTFDNEQFQFEGNANFNFAYLEGDLGAIVGGAIGQTLPFDLPFAVGIIPLVFQNGIWMEDDILGFAVTMPARNSARFDISNMDITFFAGYDKLNSPAFEGDDSAARVMGVASFLDAMNGHFEIDYAFLDDRTNADRSYHNIAIGYTRRFGRFLSNSTRVIANAGQQSNVPGTADGVLLLSENSLITGFPSTVVPYLNMFAGFDRPQSVGRAGIAGGVLRNTGILFESDNLTGYPTLDATANDTFGMAMGLNLLADEFAQQLIVEMAMLGVMGEDVNRNAQGDQYGVGVRYQLPLNNSVIFRADAMVGFLRNDEDINGARMEIRKKW